MLQRQMSAAEIFSQARKKDLPELAEKLGFRFKRSSGDKLYGNHCPHCGEGPANGNAVSLFVDENGLWRWNCFCCGKGGTSIDFIAQANNLTDMAAAKLLVEGSSFSVIRTGQANSSVARAKKAAVAKAATECLARIAAQANREDDAIFAHFASRGIRADVVERAVARDIIRFLPSSPKICVEWLREYVGEDLLKQANLWGETARWPAIAFRPIVSFFPGGAAAEFRIARERQTPDEPKAIRYGPMKWPWWWKARTSSVRKIMVVEGVMDMLSAAQMGVEDWAHIMAIPGLGTWSADLFRRAAEKYECTVGIVGIDKGEGGDKSAPLMQKEISDLGFESYRLEPTEDDWNLDLQGGRTTIIDEVKPMKR